jgi:hypothetical protein
VTRADGRTVEDVTLVRMQYLEMLLRSPVAGRPSSGTVLRAGSGTEQRPEGSGGSSTEMRAGSGTEQRPEGSGGSSTEMRAGSGTEQRPEGRA